MLERNIPRRLLVAGCSFGAALSAERVTRAIARGLAAGGRPDADECPLDMGAEPEPSSGVGARPEPGSDVRARLDSLDFDARMRRARAVVIAVPRLREQALAGSLAFEIATRARQGGVPAYAIAAENHLGSFDARILDLQLVIEARDQGALRAAGRRLARIA